MTMEHQPLTQNRQKCKFFFANNNCRNGNDCKFAHGSLPTYQYIPKNKGLIIHYELYFNSKYNLPNNKEEFETLVKSTNKKEIHIFPQDANIIDLCYYISKKVDCCIAFVEIAQHPHFVKHNRFFRNDSDKMTRLSTFNKLYVRIPDPEPGKLLVMPTAYSMTNREVQQLVTKYQFTAPDITFPIKIEFKLPHNDYPRVYDQQDPLELGLNVSVKVLSIQLLQFLPSFAQVLTTLVAEYTLSGPELPDDIQCHKFTINSLRTFQDVGNKALVEIMGIDPKKDMKKQGIENIQICYNTPWYKNCFGWELKPNEEEEARPRPSRDNNPLLGNINSNGCFVEIKVTLIDPHCMTIPYSYCDWSNRINQGSFYGHESMTFNRFKCSIAATGHINVRVNFKPITDTHAFAQIKDIVGPNDRVEWNYLPW